MAITIDQLISL